MKKALLVNLVIALACVAVALLVRDRVPDPMPSHWSAGGRPDGFLPREIGLFLAPGLIVVLSLLVVGLLQLDPRREHVAASATGVAVILVSLALFLGGIHVLLLRAALRPGHRLEESALLVLLGLLFVALGAAMPRLRSNFFAGFRTPWTLSSERNWELTHRFGAWSMAAGGLLVIGVAAVLPPRARFPVVIGVLIVAALLPVLYSYLRYRRDRRSGGTAPESRG